MKSTRYTVDEPKPRPARSLIAVAPPVSKAVTYLYCVKLPGFECQRESTSKTSSYPHTFSQQRLETSARRLRATLRSIRERSYYSMVKVGISTEPAERLYSIMRGLERFGANWSHFKEIGEIESPDDTVKNGRSEVNIIFIKKCCDIGSAESDIRKLIGDDCGQAFRDQFKRTLDDDKQSYVDKVGMTEWVLMRNDLMEAIQNQYRQNWCSISFQQSHDDHLCRSGQKCTASLTPSSCHTVTGNEFFGQMRSFHFRVLTQRVTPTSYVKIKFPPTEFAYIHKLKPSTLSDVLVPFLQKKPRRLD